MKLSGIEAITLPTQRSSRNTIVVSATIFFVIIYDVPISDLSILGVQAPVDFLGAVAWTLLIFSTINHIINWLGDFFSYQNWYQTNEVPLSTWGGIGETVSPIEHMNLTLLRLKEHAEMETKDIAYKNVISDVEKIKKQLLDSRKNFGTLHNYAKFYIFIWYLMVPCSAFLISAITLLNASFQNMTP